VQNVVGVVDDVVCSSAALHRLSNEGRSVGTK